MTTTKDTAIFCITSGKGGVGKTSLAVNMAFAMAQRGQSVLVVDGDLGLANVDLLLGLSVKKTILDIMESGVSPLESVIYPKQNLGILPATSGIPEMVTMGSQEQARLGGFLASIVKEFAYVLIDTAAGIGPSVLWFNEFANHNIIVLNPDPTSLTDSYALMKILSTKYNRKDFHLILNIVSSEEEGSQTYGNLKRVAEKFLGLNLKYLGSIPQDRAVSQAVRKQIPFIADEPQSAAARSIFSLTNRILKLN